MAERQYGGDGEDDDDDDDGDSDDGDSDGDGEDDDDREGVNVFARQARAEVFSLMGVFEPNRRTPSELSTASPDRADEFEM